MTTEIDVIRARVDEHGRLLTEHGDTIEGLTLVVLGDTSKQIKGLLQRTVELEELTKEIRAWRHDQEVAWRIGVQYARIALALLGLTGLAAWREPLAALLNVIAGG